MKRTATGGEVGSAFGPLLSLSDRCACHGRRGKGASGQASALHWSGRWVHRLPSGARPRGPSPNSLRSLRSLRSNKWRQVSPRCALRARATSPALLSAPEARFGLPERAFAETSLVFVGKANTVGLREPALALRGKPQTVAARQAVPGRGDFWGDEERSPEVGALRALQHLTRRVCLSEAERSERSELCGATSGRAPQCSRRTRRPPQHEPLPGTACRATLTQPPRESSQPTTAATGREQTSQRPSERHASRVEHSVGQWI